VNVGDRIKQSFSQLETCRLIHKLNRHSATVGACGIIEA